MSAQSRRILVAVLLALYFIWPLVQHQLVLRYRTDPWKLAGWAMYSAPSARIRVSLLGVDEADERVRIDPRSSEELGKTLEEFVFRRRTLGLFVKPIAIARELSRRSPNHREWTVIVDQVGLTPENFFGVIHRSVYRYPVEAGELGPGDVRFPAIPERQAR